MKTAVAFLSALIVGTFSSGVHAKREQNVAKRCPETLGTNVSFPKDMEITVTQYNADTRTFFIVPTEMTDEARPHVTLEALEKGVGDIRAKIEKIRKNPSSIVGEVFLTSSTVRTLLEEEAEARKGCTPRE